MTSSHLILRSASGTDTTNVLIKTPFPKGYLHLFKIISLVWSLISQNHFATHYFHCRHCHNLGNGIHSITLVVSIVLLSLLLLLIRCSFFIFFFLARVWAINLSKSNFPQNCFDSIIKLADTSLAKYSTNDVNINYISRGSTVEVKSPCLSLLIWCVNLKKGSSVQHNIWRPAAAWKQLSWAA